MVTRELMRVTVEQFLDHPDRVAPIGVPKRGVPVTLHVKVRLPGAPTVAHEFAAKRAAVIAGWLLPDRRVDVVRILVDAAGGYHAEEYSVGLLPWIGDD